MHDRTRLGAVPAALSLRDLAPIGSLSDGARGLLVREHGLPFRVLESAPLAALLSACRDDVRGRVEREIRSFPVDGFDDPAANERGETVARALADGRLLSWEGPERPADRLARGLLAANDAVMALRRSE